MMPINDFHPQHPIRLLEDSLSLCWPIYAQLLVLNTPNAVWATLYPWLQHSRWFFILSLLYLLTVGAWAWGATLSFTYHHISHSEYNRSHSAYSSSSSALLAASTESPITLWEACQDGIEYAPKLISGGIRFGITVFGKTLLLVIPGVQYFVNAYFFDYFIVINGSTAREGIRHSQDLVTGSNHPAPNNQTDSRWRQVFFAIAFGIVLFDVLTRLSIKGIIPQELSSEGNVFEVVESFLLFLSYPFGVVYNALLAYRLNSLRSRGISRKAGPTC